MPSRPSKRSTLFLFFSLSFSVSYFSVVYVCTVAEAVQFNILPFRDAATGASTFDLLVIHCVRAMEKVLQLCPLGLAFVSFYVYLIFFVVAFCRRSLLLLFLLTVDTGDSFRLV